MGHGVPGVLAVHVLIAKEGLRRDREGRGVVIDREPASSLGQDRLGLAPLRADHRQPRRKILENLERHGVAPQVHRDEERQTDVRPLKGGGQRVVRSGTQERHAVRHAFLRREHLELPPVGGDPAADDRQSDVRDAAGDLRQRGNDQIEAAPVGDIARVDERGRVRRPLAGRPVRADIDPVRDDGDLPSRLAAPELSERPAHGDDKIRALHQVNLQSGVEDLAQPRHHEARLVVHVLVDHAPDSSQDLHQIGDETGAGPDRDADVERPPRPEQAVRQERGDEERVFQDSETAHRREKPTTPGLRTGARRRSRLGEVAAETGIVVEQRVDVQVTDPAPDEAPRSRQQHVPDHPPKRPGDVLPLVRDHGLAAARREVRDQVMVAVVRLPLDVDDRHDEKTIHARPARPLRASSYAERSAAM